MHISYNADISEEGTEAKISVILDLHEPEECHPIGLRFENPILTVWLSPNEAEELSKKIQSALMRDPLAVYKGATE